MQLMPAIEGLDSPYLTLRSHAFDAVSVLGVVPKPTPHSAIATNNRTLVLLVPAGFVTEPYVPSIYTLVSYHF